MASLKRMETIMETQLLMAATCRVQGRLPGIQAMASTEEAAHTERDATWLCSTRHLNRRHSATHLGPREQGLPLLVHRADHINVLTEELYLAGALYELRAERLPVAVQVHE
jgi:hypothetical protein